MIEVLRFALLGLGPGAVYALFGQGIVLVYRGAGVLNFAHGAMGMVSAFIFLDLWQNAGLPLLVSMGLAVACAAALGAATHFLVMRGLRRASPVIRMIGTLGVLTVLQEGATLRWGSEEQLSPPVLPNKVLHPFGTLVISEDRLILFGFAVLLTVFLWAVYRFTTFGLATAAVVENERAATALGWSPNAISLANWTAGAALAGLAGCLLAPLSGVQIQTLTLTIIPTLAAALIGGFRSFPLTLAGGVALGIAESEAARYVSTPGIARSVPFLVIIVAIALRGRSLPVRGFTLERMPAVGSGRVRPGPAAVALAALGLVAWFGFSNTWLSAFTTMFAIAIVLLSLVVLIGYAGQLSLGQYAFAGLCTLVTARLVAHGWPLEVALVLGVVATAVIGASFALPALRARGVTLAVITLGLGYSVFLVIFNNSTFTGYAEDAPVGNQSFLGWSIDAIKSPAHYFIFVLCAFTVAALVVANVRRGRTGLRLIAVRTNERAAAAAGVNVLGTKVYAFALAAAIAGLGGVCIAFKSPSIVYTDLFDIFSSINAVLMAVIGGIGYITGTLFGMTFAKGGLALLIDPLLGGFDLYIGLVGGIVLLVILIFNPHGMALNHIEAAHALGRRWSSRSRRPKASRGLLAHGRLVSSPAVMPQPLEIRDLVVTFGGVVAVSEVSLTVQPGQIVELIGPNGAGKTTLVDAATGFVRPASGVVTLGTTRIDRMPAFRRARLGLVRSFQGVELFDDVTVLENLLIASDRQERRALLTDLVRPGKDRITETMAAVVADFGLEDDLDRKPDELPLGRRRLVGIARAIAARPAVLLLDEPASGLSGAERVELASTLRRTVDTLGIGILLIEHDIEFVMGVCDELTVLDFGHVIAHGHPADVRREPAVRAAYLGTADAPPGVPAQPAAVTQEAAAHERLPSSVVAVRDSAAVSSGARLSPIEPATSSAGKEPALLEARHLEAGYGRHVVVRDVSMTVHAGEVVCLLGPNGAGKTTTLLTLCGELHPLGGEVLWRGRPSRAPLHRRAREGLSYLPEGRAVFMHLSVSDNLRLGRGGPTAAMGSFPILEPLLHRRVGLLSGGEQQILAVARALASRPTVLVIDELSIGLAPLIVQQLTRVIREAADRGVGVLLVEQHLQLALQVADTIHVMQQGELRMSGPVSELRTQLLAVEDAYLSRADRAGVDAGRREVGGVRKPVGDRV